MRVRFAREILSSNKSGFTLIELLVVIAIIAILSAIVALLVNPIELMRRSRDAARMSDFDGLQKAINVVLQESLTGGAVLCSGVSAPCTGRSDTGTRVVTGGGWIKIDFSQQKTVSMPTLPIDPTNSATYHYVYYSDGTDYELDATLESSNLGDKAKNDGGDSQTLYETGTKLTLMH